MTQSVKQIWEMACPKCGASDEIDICADIWVRLCPDGTTLQPPRTATPNGLITAAPSAVRAASAAISAISAKQEANHDRAAIHSHRQRASLSIETLETRRSDSLDFHDVSVWGSPRSHRTQRHKAS